MFEKECVVRITLAKISIVFELEQENEGRLAKIKLHCLLYILYGKIKCQSIIKKRKIRLRAISALCLCSKHKKKELGR